jgi:hypothetical protein
MWVADTQRVLDRYIGVVDDQPHVIFIAAPPPEYVTKKLAAAPARR